MTGIGFSWKSHGVVLSSYLLLALLLTWPTVSQFTTHVPGDGIDDPAIVWNLWWVKYSLLNAPQNPLQTDFIFYPLGVNLAFYTLTLLNGLTTLPLLLNFGVVAASNLHMWFTFVVGGYGTFLLSLRLLTSWSQGGDLPQYQAKWVAALAGIIYAYGSSKLFYIALGQFNIASTHWLPFTILFFLKIHNQPRRWRWATLTALFMVLQAWAELTYATFLIIFMLLYSIYWLIVDQQRLVVRWPYLRSTLWLIGLFALGISPYLAAILPDMQTEGDFFVVGSGFADTFSGDLLGFFVPSIHHPLWGAWITQTDIRSFDKGTQIYLGYILLCLAGTGLFAGWRRRSVRFWFIASLIFVLLILGPEIIVNGTSTGIPGPFVILQKLPIFNGNRYPSRFSVMLLLSLTPLAALGTYHLMRKLNPQPSRVFVLILATLVLFENLSLPLPQSSMTVPEPYHYIAQEPDIVTVLDIPYGWRNGFRVTGAQTVGIMFGQFYQTYHQKPILHGNTSRNPELKLQYFTEAPVLNSLTRLETGYPLSSQMLLEDEPYAADVLRFFNIKYIVVRPETPSYLNHPQNTVAYIEQIFPVEKRYQDDSFILYEVDLPSLPASVDLLTPSPLSTLYFAEGWGIRQEQIAAQRNAVSLLVPMNGQAQQAEFRVASYRQNTTQFWITLNDWQSAPVTLQDETQSVTIDIPERAVLAGLNLIQLQFSQVAQVAPFPAEITVISAGEEGGNLGHIYLNGIDVSPNQTGYNVALIHAERGLLEVANFNTHADPDASEALAAFITSAPADAIIAVAAKDEASGDPKRGATGNLSEVAVAALRSIGAQVDLRGQWRASHAFIGGKIGFRPREASDAQQRPVKVSSGPGLTEPTVAAIFEKIVFEAVE